MRGTRGIQLFLEYYDNPEANEKSFTEDGWFKTGDIVSRCRPTATSSIRDRDKDALKVGGENVSAKEVEDACRTVAGIGDIAVVGQEHDMLDQVAVAFVIPAPERADDDLRRPDHRACKARLADFKVPEAVYFVDEFPRADARQGREEQAARAGRQLRHEVAVGVNAAEPRRVPGRRRPSAIIHSCAPNAARSWPTGTS